NVAIPVSMRVRFGAAVIYSEFQFEVVFWVSQVNKSEIVELEAFSNFQPKCFPVEIDRFSFIDNADHAVKNFSHVELPILFHLGASEAQKPRCILIRPVTLAARLNCGHSSTRIQKAAPAFRRALRVNGDYRRKPYSSVKKRGFRAANGPRSCS